MNSFDKLLNTAGTWNGHNRVQPTPADPVNESTSQLIVTPILRNNFIRLDQTWAWNDTPQSGSFLIGHDPKSNIATLHWIDTWHNGTSVMPLIGHFDPNGFLIANGHFAVNDSPDWGWRIEIQPHGTLLKINMFCLNPNCQKEEGWVWSEYRHD